MKRHRAVPAVAGWQEMATRLCRRLHITRSIQLLESAAVEVPTVIGWLKPVVLLPASAARRSCSAAARSDPRARACAYPPSRLPRQPAPDRWSRRCCSITRRSGGCRAASASSVRTAAMTSPSPCAAIRTPTPRLWPASRSCAVRAASRSRRPAARCFSGCAVCLACRMPGSEPGWFAGAAMLLLAASAAAVVGQDLRGLGTSRRCEARGDRRRGRRRRIASGQ